MVLDGGAVLDNIYIVLIAYGDIGRRRMMKEWQGDTYILQRSTQGKQMSYVFDATAIEELVACMGTNLLYLP